MDRWRFSELPSDDASAQTEPKTFTNYLDFGLAATIALDFHNARERGELADLGRSALKLAYGKFGLRRITGPQVDLADCAEMSVDGQPVDLRGIIGVVVLNINSYGAGTDMWPRTDVRKPGLTQQSISDGVFEVSVHGEQ